MWKKEHSAFRLSRRTIGILAALLLLACAETFIYAKYGAARFHVPWPAGALTVDEAWNYIRERENIVLVDVRSRKEFSGSHLPGAVNIPLHSLPRLAGLIPPNHPVLVYGLDGVRAVQAYKLLCRLRIDLSDIRYVSGWIVSLPKP